LRVHPGKKFITYLASTTGLSMKGRTPMRIALPMSGDCLEQHFGHCEKFVMIEVTPETKKLGKVTVIAAPEHQPGLLPVWLKDHGVTLVIAGGMGARARSLLQEASIEVITGAPSEKAATLVRRYLDGALATIERTCDHVCNH
jgi:ATP-binding protein involved in chromosome partitioning